MLYITSRTIIEYKNVVNKQQVSIEKLLNHFNTMDKAIRSSARESSA